ncbi:MAG TPA: hypothetical protein VEC01_18405 [Noviherbaspirillum sp.]|uniref:hypothetical protein n=1 Tax=Noviherbaspirillum sp. TaxID=1926288 RepID=UPI002D29C7C6|nr:hypothetical protein [Noviherbaspirillum sp.]HYD97303.1 hypothetical protein [Noviherbaspirillum sp.]
MRLVLAALLTMTSALNTAHAATQQQCESLIKPLEAKIDSLPHMRGNKPTSKDCASAAEMIKLYAGYQVQADRMNCPFAYVAGQAIGGAPERADLIAEIKKAYSEKCR